MPAGVVNIESLRKDLQTKAGRMQYLIKENVNIVLQINGRKRGIIVNKRNVDEEMLINEIKNNFIYDKYLKNKKIIKSIYIKNKLINLILK